MFNNLTYKKKYQLFLAALALAAIFVYVLGIKKTINAIADNITLNHKLELAINAPQQIADIEVSLKQMERHIISGGEEEQNDFEQLLLERVTGFCQQSGLTLIEFPQTDISTYQDYQVFTNLIVLEGSFKQLLQFIYEAELQYKIGKVVSVDFKRIKDIRTKRLHLYAYIYFQNIKITSNE